MYTTADLLHLVREPALMPWGMQYFFLIETSLATFFLSLPGLVWRSARWRRISRSALLTALVCGLSAPLVLLIDLQQPDRALSLYLHPDPDSWLAWGVLFIPIYLFGLLLYSWLCLRTLLGKLALERNAGRYLRLFYRVLAYGGYENLGAIRAAAVVAASGALLAQLYTGMEVMAAASAGSPGHAALKLLLLIVSSLAGGLGVVGVFEAIAGAKPAVPMLCRWLERSLWGMMALLIAVTTTAPAGPAATAVKATEYLRHIDGWPYMLIGATGVFVITLWLLHRRHRHLLVSATMSVLSAWIVRWSIFIDGSHLPDMAAILRADFVSAALSACVSISATAVLCLTLFLTLTYFIPWNDATEFSGG